MDYRHDLDLSLLREDMAIVRNIVTYRSIGEKTPIKFSNLSARNTEIIKGKEVRSKSTDGNNKAGLEI